MPFRYRTVFESLKSRLRLESLPKRTGHAEHSGQHKHVAGRFRDFGTTWRCGGDGGSCAGSATTRSASSWAAKVGGIDRRAAFWVIRVRAAARRRGGDIVGGDHVVETVGQGV